MYYYNATLDPLFDALQCTCIGVGNNCREAINFNYDFWHKYWKEDVPGVFKELDILKGNSSDASTAAAPAPAANESAAATALYIAPKVVQHAKHALLHHWHHKKHHRKHVEVLVEDEETHQKTSKSKQLL